MVGSGKCGRDFLFLVCIQNFDDEFLLEGRSEGDLREGASRRKKERAGCRL
jgi:hypothetical protein